MIVVFPYALVSCSSKTDHQGQTEIMLKLAHYETIVVHIEFQQYYIGHSHAFGIDDLAVHPILWFGFRFMVFNATFNNISVISWQSVLLVREIGVP